MAYINSIVDREGNSYSIRDHRITNEKWDSLDNLSGYPPFPDGPGAASLYLDGSGRWSAPEQHQEGPVSPDHDTNKYYNGNGEWSVPPDTKDTAGSTNSTSKLFLIGATSQTTSSVTKSNEDLFYEDNSLYIYKNQTTTGRYISVNSKNCRMEAGATIQVDGADHQVVQYFNFDPENRKISINADINTWSNSAILINNAGNNETSIRNLRLYGTTGGWTYISVGDNPPSNPSVGDIWIDTNEV